MKRSRVPSISASRIRLTDRACASGGCSASVAASARTSPKRPIIRSCTGPSPSSGSLRYRSWAARPPTITSRSRATVTERRRDEPEPGIRMSVRDRPRRRRTASRRSSPWTCSPQRTSAPRAARTSCISRSASPAAVRPPLPWTPPARARERVPLGYTEALGRPALRSGDRRALPGELRPRGRSASRSSSRSARRVPSCSAFSPRSTPAIGSWCRSPPFRPTRTSCKRSASRSCASASAWRRPSSRRSSCCKPIEPPVHGLVIASPANPTGTMLQPAELAALARHCRAHGIRLISDEIYHGITYAATRRQRAGVRPGCGGDQRLLQVLLHDRLASRLAGRTARPGAADRAARPEPVHLAAGARPGGGARSARLQGRARPPDRGLSPQPGSAPRASARSRARSAGPGRRRLLSLCRRRPPDRRFRRVLPATARRNRGRAHAGRRFRQRRRPPLRPPRLRGEP